MPDPREVSFSSEVIFSGFPDGRPSEIWDEYGRRPWDSEFLDEVRRDKEWDTFHAFQGEFARIHGPRHRGYTCEFDRGRLDDGPEYHEALLRQENPKLSRQRIGRTR